jgi:predicted acylesterase/phospholipase RssA
MTTYSWILDSGGAGRGAWQGGVIHEFMRWCRESGSFPSITMGASAGGYAAADVATGTEQTVMKGWTHWGKGNPRVRTYRGRSRFRAHLRDSIHYVMEEKELSGVFQENASKKLLVFTTRVRRSDGQSFCAADRMRYFFKSATRKLPRPLKYLPERYIEDPVIFALNLPSALWSGYVRPLTRRNYHAVIEASCLVPLAMGPPLLPGTLAPETGDPGARSGDRHAVFMDGGFSLKMPMRIFEEDARFESLARWVSADKTVIFCCDPGGMLWETSSRLRCLNSLPSVARAMRENRLLVVSPDHKLEAGFLCVENETAMRTFTRGQEQAQRLLRSDPVRRFFET